MNDTRLLWKLKLKLRKATTPIHVIFGLICAAFIPFCWPITIALMGFFFAWEYWQDKCNGDNQGNQDFWEAFASFATGSAVIAILSYLGYLGVMLCI